MVWVGLTIGVGLVALALLLALSRLGTLYVHNPMGFIAFSAGPKPRKQITHEQMLVLVRHVVEGRVIDFLGISADRDLYRGISIIEDGGEISLSIDYQQEPTADETNTVIQFMIQRGAALAQQEDHEDLEKLEFRVPRDPEVIFELALWAVGRLPAPVGNVLFAEAELIKEGVGRGIHFKRNRDRISELLPAHE